MTFYPFFDSKDSISNINIFFDKRITEAERLIVRNIIEKYENNSTSKVIKFKKMEFLKLMNYPEKTDNSDVIICEYFAKLMKKQVNYVFSMGNKENIYKGFFSVISSFILDTENISVKIPEEIKLGLKKGNLFSKVSIISALKLQLPASTPLFLYLLSNCKENKGTIHFSLEEFRNLLNSSDSYDRFYDFEKNLLIPVLNDISSKTHFILSSSKVKSGSAKTSRVTGIDISYENIILNKRLEEVDYLFSLIKDKINNFQLIQKTIYDSLDSYDYSQVYEIITTSKKLAKKNIDQYIVDHLPLSQNSLIKDEDNETKNSVVVEKLIYSLYELHSEVNKALLSIGVGANHSSDLITYKKLCTIKPEDEFSVSSDEYKLTVFYSLRTKSRITITKL